MQKKGAALRAVQESDVAEVGKDSEFPDRGPGQAARLDFTPVPRRYRHDGWTPERQRAFIAALADTGCVDRAARMVNMAQTNCYALRRAEGAEEFRRAWEAALDFGLMRLKDIAFERAIEGELIPVFSAGKLMGYRRKRNDALLIFCLRHYGQDAQGRRVTVNYFSTRASAGAVSADAGTPPPCERCECPPDIRSPVRGTERPSHCGRSPSPVRGGAAQAEASATTVRTVITGKGDGGSGAERQDAAAAVLNGFEGIALDAEAQAAIARALADCAARARAAEAAYAEGGAAAATAAADDPGESFFRSEDYHGALVPACLTEAFIPFVEGEPHWQLAGAEKPEMLVRWEDEQQARKAAGEEEGADAGEGEGGRHGSESRDVDRHG